MLATDAYLTSVQLYTTSYLLKDSRNMSAINLPVTELLPLNEDHIFWVCCSVWSRF